MGAMRTLGAATVGLAAAWGAAGACTAFSFPRPQESADASVAQDGSAVDAGAAETPAPQPGYLGPSDAARLCAVVFKCARLAQTITRSIVLPLDTPSSPLNFSACMDWAAGPIDPKRPGFAAQQAMLLAVAGKTSCADAYAAVPVQPLEGAPCSDGCLGTSTRTWCDVTAGRFSVACGPPVYAEAGTCVAIDGGAQCLTLGPCSPGLSCSGSTRVECIAGIGSSAIDCTLSGRLCVHGACVTPGQSTAPCPASMPHDDCQGSLVQHCAGTVEGQTQINCAAVGRTCSANNAAGAARCVGPADSCSPFDPDQNACSGSVIRVCVGGAPLSFDCASVGLGCQPGDTTHTAHCG
jgi:hypothetical protein